MDEMGSNDGSEEDEGSSRLGKAPTYTPLVPEAWKEKCVRLGDLHIIKFRRVIQSLIYFLRFANREDVCEKYTNRLEWKRVRDWFSSTG
jgi:hypothetical protein